jgi:hypothetical protein
MQSVWAAILCNAHSEDERRYSRALQANNDDFLRTKAKICAKRRITTNNDDSHSWVNQSWIFVFNRAFLAAAGSAFRRSRTARR